MPLHQMLPMDPVAAAIAASRVWSYGGRGLARVFDHVDLTGHRLVARMSAGRRATVRKFAAR